jgi:hypothetical protein
MRSESYHRHDPESGEPSTKPGQLQSWLWESARGLVPSKTGVSIVRETKIVTKSGLVSIGEFE